MWPFSPGHTKLLLREEVSGVLGLRMEEAQEKPRNRWRQLRHSSSAWKAPGCSHCAKRDSGSPTTVSNDIHGLCYSWSFKGLPSLITGAEELSPGQTSTKP